MPRRKQLSDEAVLDAALDVLGAHGPRALTFAALGSATSLSPATLVQRFGSKAELLHRTLAHAWERLERRTAELGEAAERSPAGAVGFLTGLSEQYGGIDEYADALLVLREDLRDPRTRRRGTAWKESLTAVLDACLADEPGAPAGVGELVATYWQGTLLWWGFDPRVPVTEHVEREITALLGTLLR